MDAGLHQVQGKAGRVTDLLTLLQEFYREKLSELLRHEAGARHVRQYDANNTYQYVINREETQLSWVGHAILDLGGEVPAAAASEAASGTKGKAIFEADAREAQAFVDRWRPRVDAMTNARHRSMLNVILGETLEQKRFFEQALAGETELLGKRAEHAGARVGSVLPTRWIE
jgi:hypothetical protein